jgi:hypothetical protein
MGVPEKKSITMRSIVLRVRETGWMENKDLRNLIETPVPEVQQPFIPIDVDKRQLTAYTKPHQRERA